MYLDYYNITVDPFISKEGKTSLWFGANMSEVASTLKKAISEREGIISLTGDTGSGKKTIVKMTTDILRNQFVITTLSNPDLTTIDFFNILSVKFGFNIEFKSKSAFLVHLRNFLRSSFSVGKNILLIINDADRLKTELFEELILLSDIELNDIKMISILLVGQKRWIEGPSRRNIKEISSKIAVKCNLDPLNEEETARYINYCLATAGTKRNIFNEKAIHQIFSFSQGNLNLINTICNHALTKGYAKRKATINSAIIEECEEELQEIIQIPGDAKPHGPQIVSMTKSRKKSSASGFSVPARKWFWSKAVLLILLLFSSYLLYTFQTEDSNLWESDEIAQKEYDFKKFKDKGIVSSGSPQGVDENYTRSASASHTSEAISSTNKNQDSEAFISGKERSPNASLEIKQRWPFATFKKIIYFKYDSNTLPPDSLEILDKIAEFAIHNPNKEYVIKGYTDSTGAYSYNLTISKFRADSVKNYLIAKGVNPARISASGLGSQDPIFSNATAGGRKLNRRVEIELRLE